MSTEGDGGFAVELQASRIADAVNSGATRGADKTCPYCSGPVNPVEFLYNNGVCSGCRSKNAQARVRGRLA